LKESSGFLTDFKEEMCKLKM